MDGARGDTFGTRLRRLREAAALTQEEDWPRGRGCRPRRWARWSAASGGITRPPSARSPPPSACRARGKPPSPGRRRLPGPMPPPRAGR